MLAELEWWCWTSLQYPTIWWQKHDFLRKKLHIGPVHRRELDDLITYDGWAAVGQSFHGWGISICFLGTIGATGAGGDRTLCECWKWFYRVIIPQYNIFFQKEVKGVWEPSSQKNFQQNNLLVQRPLSSQDNKTLKELEYYFYPRFNFHWCSILKSWSIKSFLFRCCLHLYFASRSFEMVPFIFSFQKHTKNCIIDV